VRLPEWAYDTGFAVGNLDRNVARIAGDHLTNGHHHPGVLIGLSSRFSRRPAGRRALVASVLAIADKTLEDRVVFLIWV
jgi:hypothetical protein